MAIDINNANYKLFTDFAATAAKQTTRAAIGTLLTEDGEARTVRASTRWDFIGNVGRLSATRADNNAVRDLFSKTIADMFGGEDRIPANVKDAMKLGDYGHGKPLTARRACLSPLHQRSPTRPFVEPVRGKAPCLETAAAPVLA